jgi:hypothetical protein
MPLQSVSPAGHMPTVDTKFGSEGAQCVEPNSSSSPSAVPAGIQDIRQSASETSQGVSRQGVT